MRTAELHPLIVLVVRALQVVLQDLGGADDDVVVPHDVGEGDLELGVPADPAHLEAPQERSELTGVMLLHQGDLSTHTHAHTCMHTHTHTHTRTHACTHTHTHTHKHAYAQRDAHTHAHPFKTLWYQGVKQARLDREKTVQW